MSGFKERCLGGLIVLLGIALAGYPWLSNRLYEHHVDSAVSVYREEVHQSDSRGQEAYWEAAREYNVILAEAGVRIAGASTPTNRTGPDYEAVLSVDAQGTMGFLEIPKIGVYLPIYHGTSEAVLKKGIGHLQGTSLPVGGEGTRSVLSGHTGLNNSRMLTDLIDMEEGDLFFLHILDEILTYRVDEILVIEPDDTEALRAEADRDLVSLLTCTPYGVNSHRLVVTGERIDIDEEATAAVLEEQGPKVDAQWNMAYLRAIVVGVGGALLLCTAVGLFRRRKKRRREKSRRSAADEDEE